MRNFDVIVIGVGAMGSACAYQLAGRGLRVLGLEQFGIPHALGSSHGFSRMIRLAYYEHPDYVPLLLRAYELWDELERESGQKLLHITGGVYMGGPGSEVVSGSIQAARMHGLPHEVLDRKQIADRFRMFELPDDFSGIFEPRAGFLHPERVVAAFAEQAMRRGAELHGQEPVVEWSADSHGVKVRTVRETYHADRLIIAGGAWSGRLLSDLGIELLVTRQIMGWVWPRQPELFELGKFPVWAIDHADGGMHYGFPMMPDNPGFKIAFHARGAPADPDRVIRDLLPGDEATFRDALTRYLPAADGPLLAMRVCLYTNSPDSHFIIDRHPHHQRVTFACGFSGHGFKFASAIGEVLADLAMRGTTRLPIDFLKLKRF